MATARKKPAPMPEAPDRRQNILLAAEKLFGLRGFHAVSIRDIAAEAGVPLALVGYYFGAKHELYHAIFESWQGSIDQRLAALRSAAGDLRAKDTLERILAAWIDPLVELARHPEGQYYALMAARDLASPTPESERAQIEFFDPMAHAFIDTLQLVFPKASRGQVAWCYQFMLGAVLHYLTDVRVERLSRGENRAGDPAAKTALMRFIAAGFRGTLPTR
jgi:AcrR family transcriptional regulator